MALADEEGLILGCSHSEVAAGPLLELWKTKFQTRNQKQLMAQCSCKATPSTASVGMKHPHFFHRIYWHLRNLGTLWQFSLNEDTAGTFLQEEFHFLRFQWPWQIQLKQAEMGAKRKRMQTNIHNWRQDENCARAIFLENLAKNVLLSILESWKH